MSHCESCSGFLRKQKFGSRGEAEYPTHECPGCGHEDLEAKLAEARTKFAEVLTAIDNERIALRATLAQAREALRVEYQFWLVQKCGCGFPCNQDEYCEVYMHGKRIKEALAALDAGKEVAVRPAISYRICLACGLTTEPGPCTHCGATAALTVRKP